MFGFSRYFHSKQARISFEPSIYFQIVKTKQQFACLLASFLLKIALDSDAFTSVGNEFHSIPSLYNEKDPL